LTTWDDISAKGEAIKSHLPHDFCRLALNESLAVARFESPLRGNFFAAGMREVISMTLHFNAPDEHVVATPGFKFEKDLTRPTQAQRFDYWARAGLDPTFVADNLEVDLKKPVEAGKAALKELSQRVHFREGTRVGDEAAVLELVWFSLEGLGAVIAAAEETRLAITEALAEEINDEALNTFIMDTIDAVDELATHHSIEGVYVNDVSVIQQAPDRLRFEVQGTLSVGLQWGSNSDVRRGDGAELDEHFKFELSFTAAPLTPTEFEDATYRLNLGLWERDDVEQGVEQWT
jgi:hypothetical protein